MKRKNNQRSPKLTQTIELVGDDIIKIIVALSHMLMKVEERLSTLIRET